MDKIQFQIVALGCCKKRDAVQICINGRDLADWVREVEAESAAREGRASLAGAYDGLDPEQVLPPGEHFMGVPAPDLVHAEGIQILGCDCGDAGCWPLLCQIEVEEKRVRWFQFRQPFRSGEHGHALWRYDELGPFEFDREQYEEALKRAQH